MDWKNKKQKQSRLTCAKRLQSPKELNVLLYFTTNIITVVSSERLANQKGVGGATDGPD